MRTPAPLRRVVLGLTTSAVLVGGTLVGTPAEAATPQAESAAGWLTTELQDGVLVLQGFPSYGPTLDVFFAFDSLGVRRGARGAILAALADNVGSYIGAGRESYAGPTGKLLTAATADRRDPRDFGGVNLVARLADRIRTGDGPQRGRAVDRSQYGEYSNTIGQSFVVRGLAAADHRLLRATTRFLLKQQCPAGFFREDMDSSDFTCRSGRGEGLSAPSVDSTAYAVMALSVARRNGVAGLGDDIRDAVSWLRDRQNDNGSFNGVSGPSANSTGLVATVLPGRFERAANRALRWLSRRQVTARNSDGTALAGDVGAIANNGRAFRDGAQDGITDGTRGSWYLATAQSAAALDDLPRR